MQTKNRDYSSRFFFKRQIFMLISVVSILLFSCQKEINADLKEVGNKESFFKSIYTPKETEPVIGALKKQLAEKDFLNEFITSNGFPQWERSLMLKGKGDTLYTLLVPTKKENQIDAFFAATVNRDGQVLFEMHHRDIVDVPEYSYVGITRQKALFFLDKFDGKKHPLQKGGDTATSNYVVEICWYQWENTCIATEANIVLTNCWKLLLHCEDIEGNELPGGGETGGGGCTNCVPPPCYAQYWFSSFVPEESPCPELQILIQQLNQILSPGDSYVFATIQPNYALPNVSTVNQFQIYLTTIDQNTTFDFSTPAVPNQVGNDTIVRARINRTFVGGEDIFVKMKKNAQSIWDFDSVTSDDWGVTLGWSWSTTGVPAPAISTTPTEITVDVYGYEKYNIIIDGIGTVYKKLIHYRVKINRISGAITSIAKI